MAEASAEERIRVTVVVVGSASMGRDRQAYELLVPSKLAEAAPTILSALEERIPQQHLQTFLLVINGRHINLLSPDTLLQNGDKVTVIPPVGGGAPSLLAIQIDTSARPNMSHLVLA